MEKQNEILPFKVLYADGSSSWELQEGKSVEAFLFGGYWIAVNTSKKQVFLRDASVMVAKENICGVVCSLLPVDDLFALMRWQMMLNVFLTIIGADKLGNRYWGLEKPYAPDIVDEGWDTHRYVEHKGKQVYTITCYDSDMARAGVLPAIRVEALNRLTGNKD